MGEKWTKKVLVAGIDFGTTYSGIALSFLSEYKKDKSKIICPEWKSRTHPSTRKTPTVLLLNPERKLDSFGYEAEEKYADLIEKQQHKKWSYFTRFKMLLHGDENLSLETTVMDSEGREFKAMQIVSLSIGYFKSKIISLVNEKEPYLDESHIYYVITTPAIWSERAKSFMRVAAEKAGISAEHVRIALEPECAAVYVKTLGLATHRRGAATGAVSPMSPNSCYMVVDMGGGTIDFTVHGVSPDGKLQEKIIPKGGPWGGDTVNEQFRQFLIKLIGAPALTEFCNSERDDYLTLMRDFEVKKCAWNDTEIKLSLPLSFCDIHKHENKEELIESLRQTRFQKLVSFKRGNKMALEKELCDEFFKGPIKKTVECIADTVKTVPLNIDTLLLVGWFSDCELMKKAIKDRFPDKVILIPPVEAVLSVVKGAILYGRDPSLIDNRICRYTYGIDWNEPFDQKKHPEGKKELSDGGYMCSDIFRILMKKGDSVSYQHEEVIEAFVKNTRQEQLHFPFYRSEKLLQPTFVDDKGCCKIGTLVVDLPKGGRGLDKPVQLHVKFGATEIHVEAIDTTGRKCIVQFNLFETAV